MLDWDDTLFPTSWTLKNNIDLNNNAKKNKYIVFYSKLDLLLYKLLTSFMKCGKVVIVTNAMVKWVGISSTILPNTKRLLQESDIDIVSAREAYQKKHPGDMFLWKRNVFENVVTDYFDEKSLIENIISVGDAEYEFKALIR